MASAPLEKSNAAVVVFAWLLVAGRPAYAGKAAAAGPANWWLALAIDLLIRV